MATVGRKPKPKRIKELTGSKHVNEREPTPVVGAPRMPAGLPERAKKYWRRLVKQLDYMGLLTQADQDALTLLCVNLAIAEEAAEAMAEEGVLRPDGRGRKAKNPAWQIYREANQAARQLFAEFGLTPSARQRLHVDVGADDDINSILDALVRSASD